MEAIILAGGQSRRMGTDKAFLRLGGSGPTMLDRVIAAVNGSGVCEHMVLVANQAEKYRDYGLEIVPDNFPGQGPLAGLEAGIAATSGDYYLLVACDMPFLQPALLAALGNWPRRGPDGQEWQALVPLNPEGRPEPLCAVYRRNSLEPARQCLRERRNKITNFLDLIRVDYIQAPDLLEFDPELLSLRNLNTVAEFQEASSQL